MALETDGPRFLVVGCGGIGGIVSASLLFQQLDVTPLTRNEGIADAINARGFRIHGDVALGTVVGNAVTKLPKGCPPFDYILVATQPPQVEDAAREVAGHLKADGAMVVFQNGLCEERIAPIVGRERVIGAIVGWGASMIEPGVYDRTSAGGFTLGKLEGAEDRRLEQLALFFQAIGPVNVTQNLSGARWSKLAINCAISALGTVGGDRLGVLMRKRFVRRLTLELMSETVAVARAEGVRLEKVSGTLDLDWIALTDDERASKVGSPSLFTKHALLLAVGTRYRRLRSSMLNAIERGREPAVEFLNGEVVSRGSKYGISTPINEAIAALIREIAAGKARSSHETLRKLYDDTRSIAGASTSQGEPVPPSEPAPPAPSEPAPPSEPHAPPPEEKPDVPAADELPPAT